MSGIISDNLGRSSGLVKSGVTTFDDTDIRSDIVTQALKEAITENRAAYNLPNSMIEQFQDDTKIGSETTGDRNSNEYWSTISLNADTKTSGSGTYTRGDVSSINLLVVAGGGGGGGDTSGGAGAGGLVYIPGYDISGATTYANAVGAGGAGSSTYASGSNGSDSTFGTVTAKGGGGGGSGGSAGPDGGSGGAPRRGESSDTGDSTQVTTQAGYTNVGWGNESGLGDGSGGSGAGGGAGAVGGSDTYSADGSVSGGIGGAGRDYSSVYGTGVGDSGWFAGGGGGGSEGSGAGGVGGQGGGAAGGDASDAGINATANTGGGSGGGRSAGANGGSGIIIIGELETSATGTLISTAQTANAAQTVVSGVIVYKNHAGTATLGTDLKVYFTCNGSTYTESTLSAAGTFSSGLLMAKCAATTCTSGTDVRYKVVWANQASGSKETQLHAVGMNY